MCGGGYRLARVRTELIARTPISLHRTLAIFPSRHCDKKNAPRPFGRGALHSLLSKRQTVSRSVDHPEGPFGGTGGQLCIGAQGR
jgi:hypothetical protein